MQSVCIVLGGGLDAIGQLPQSVASRIELAVERSPAFDAIIFSSRYTLNKPQVVDHCGLVQFEAKVMLDYFKKMAPNAPSALFLELASTDTIGSALYTRAQIESMGWQPKEVTVITSGWHLDRSKIIFNWAFSLQPQIQRLGSLRIVCANTGTTVARAKREATSIKSFKKKWQHIGLLRDAWSALYTQHTNYNENAASVVQLSDGYDY